MLCFERKGEKLQAFMDWKPGTRALVTGDLVFSSDASQPYDFIISTFEANIPQDTYCNQVVLGNAHFAATKKQVEEGNAITERDSGIHATKIATTRDNSDVKTYLYLEAQQNLHTKLKERIQSGRHICVGGQLREYRKDGDISPYRAILATNFTTRKPFDQSAQKKRPTGTAAGYSGTPDPTPEY